MPVPYSDKRIGLTDNVIGCNNFESVLIMFKRKFP